MKNKTQNWDYNQFLGFLFLYCANRDFKISKEETIFIRLKTKKADLKDVKKTYNSLKSDYDIIQTILSLKQKFFKTKKEQNKIIEDIKELFLSDNEFKFIEMIIFEKLSELFKM